MRRRHLSGRPTAGPALAAIVLGLLQGPVLAQSLPPLRGPVPDDPPPLQVQGDVRGKVALDKPPVRLKKPANVARIRTAPVPDLRPAQDDPPLIPAPDVSGAAQAAAEALAKLAPPQVDAAPPLPRRRPKGEDDPYAALGYDTGAFLLKPSIEVDFGYNDNPGQQPGKAKGASFVTVLPRMEFASQWPRHELTGSIEGGYTRFLGIDDKRPTLNAQLDGRLDVTRDTVLTSQLRLNLDTERLGSDGVSATAAQRPVTVTTGGTLGVEQRLGNAFVRLRGSVDRTAYDEQLTSETSYNTYGTSLRAGYEISPAIKPFVEALADARVHDETIDAGGFRRDSRGLTGRGGVTFDLAKTLTGEVSAGYGSRRYDDIRLPDLDGVLVDASLVWSPTALTTVTLKAASMLAETTYSGSSGAVNRTFGVTVAHALRRNVIVTAGLSQTRADYDAIGLRERTIDGTLGIEYRLSHSMAVKASYAYEHLNSTTPGADYTANSIMVGLKLQH